MKIAFETLGCKINQFDTAVMKDQAIESGQEIVSFGQSADVYVINTCSVTENGDAQSRRLVRKALRRNEDAKIVVTGCYAQTNPEAVRNIPGVNLVLGTQERGNWLDYLGGCDLALGTLEAVNPNFSEGPIDQWLIRGFSGRTRAFIKVQDGCDARCSFCLIPRARGPSRSVPVEGVLRQIRLLAAGAYQEVVLTGINLGFYGRDFTPKYSLAKLVKTILKETSIPRIRLSSVEPKTMTKELIATIHSSRRICRHLHIPLQSGNDQVLKAMNRFYSVTYYRKLILKLYETIPDLCLGTDVMVGFPTETEREFSDTRLLLEELPFAYFHVFPYSPRPQTKAATMDPQNNGSEKTKRSLFLRKLSICKQKDYYNHFLGKHLAVLVENGRDPETGHLRGYTDNYIRVLLNGPDSWMNHTLPVLLESNTIHGVIGLNTSLPIIPSA